MAVGLQIFTSLSVLAIFVFRIPGATPEPSPTLSSPTTPQATTVKISPEIASTATTTTTTTTTAEPSTVNTSPLLAAATTTITTTTIQPISDTQTTGLPQTITTTTSVKPSPLLVDSTTSTLPQKVDVSPTLSTTPTSLSFGETQQPAGRSSSTALTPAPGDPSATSSASTLLPSPTFSLTDRESPRPTESSTSSVSTTSTLSQNPGPSPTVSTSTIQLSTSTSGFNASPTVPATTSTTTTVVPAATQTSMKLEISSTVSSSTLERSPTLSSTTTTTTTTEASAASLTTKFPQPSPTVADENQPTSQLTTLRQGPLSPPASPKLTSTTTTTTTKSTETQSSVTQDHSPTLSQTQKASLSLSTPSSTVAQPALASATTTASDIPEPLATLYFVTQTGSTTPNSKTEATSSTSATTYDFAKISIYLPASTTAVRLEKSPNVPFSPTLSRVSSGSSAKLIAPSTTISYRPPAGYASIAGVNPLSGPASGGTRVTISGLWLNMSAVDAVYIGSNVIVRVEEISFSSVVVLTPPSADVGSPQRISVHFSGNAVISTSFDFTYQPNPIITGLSPTDHIADGGTAITVAGSSLNSVAQPIITLTVVGTTPARRRRTVSQTFSNQTCRVVSSQTMVCPVPPLPQDVINSLQNGGSSLQPDPGSIATLGGPNGSMESVYMGFVLDGYDKYSNISNALPNFQLAFFPAPTLQRQTDIVFDPETQTTIDIKGTNMTRGCRLVDYAVTVGGIVCTNVNLFDDRLVCQPPRQQPPPEQPSTSCGERLSIKVKVGFHDYGVYACLEYKQPTGSSSNKLLLLLLLLIIIPIVIIVVLVIVCCCCRDETGKSRRLKSRGSVDDQHCPSCNCNGESGRDSAMSAPRYYYGEIDGNRTSNVELYPIEEEAQSTMPDVAYSRVIGNGYAADRSVENEGSSCGDVDGIHPAVRRHMERVSSRALSVQPSARYSMRPTDLEVDELVDVSVPPVDQNSRL